MPLECQTVCVEWLTVTRPADSTRDQIFPAASRSCVCGHPVYDDQELRCALCACQDHQPGFPAAHEYSSPLTAGVCGEEGMS